MESLMFITRLPLALGCSEVTSQNFEILFDDCDSCVRRIALFWFDCVF